VNIYLDTSSIVKRYFSEPGEDIIDSRYEDAKNGKAVLLFSVWNVGEFMDALNKKVRKSEMTSKERDEAISDFWREVVDLSNNDVLIVVPVTDNLLRDAWQLARSLDLYVADALQISSAKERMCNLFLTADGNLASHASKYFQVQVT
jgi:predicted nucleic acid-binding protein